MKYPGYEPELICAQSYSGLSGKGTAISTLDHAATTPRANEIFFMEASMANNNMQFSNRNAYFLFCSVTEI